MIKVLLFDFSRVILFAKDDVPGSLGVAYDERKGNLDSIWTMFSLNTELLKWISENREGKKTALLSASMVLETNEEVQEKMGVFFDRFYFPKRWDMHKSQPSIYKKVAESLVVETNEIFFTDDTPQNIQAAKETGVHTHLYTSNENFFSHLQKLQESNLL